MKLISKSEWFELPSPIGELGIKWNKDRPYRIERIVKENGDIVWFGLNTNWVKKNGDEWTYLGVDESVKATVFIRGENGMGDYSEYPEGRNVFIPCNPPVYEELYIQLNLMKQQ